jgi:hypothetical protein
MKAVFLHVNYVFVSTRFLDLNKYEVWNNYFMSNTEKQQQQQQQQLEQSVFSQHSFRQGSQKDGRYCPPGQAGHGPTILFGAAL